MSTSLYETDYHRWTQETAEQLRRGERALMEVGIDVPALLEEVEDLGKKEQNALQSRLAILIGHLLKWDEQPAKRSRSWQATIELQRKRIERLLQKSPSLRHYLPEILSDAYSDGILLAVKETGVDRDRFVTQYTLDEILTTKSVDKL